MRPRAREARLGRDHGDSHGGQTARQCSQPHKLTGSKRSQDILGIITHHVDPVAGASCVEQTRVAAFLIATSSTKWPDTPTTTGEKRGGGQGPDDAPAYRYLGKAKKWLHSRYYLHSRLLCQNVAAAGHKPRNEAAFCVQGSRCHFQQRKDLRKGNMILDSRFHTRLDNSPG